MAGQTLRFRNMVALRPKWVSFGVPGAVHVRLARSMNSSEHADADAQTDVVVLKEKSSTDLWRNNAPGTGARRTAETQVSQGIETAPATGHQARLTRKCHWLATVGLQITMLCHGQLQAVLGEKETSHSSRNTLMVSCGTQSRQRRNG